MRCANITAVAAVWVGGLMGPRNGVMDGSFGGRERGIGGAT